MTYAYIGVAERSKTMAKRKDVSECKTNIVLI